MGRVVAVPLLRPACVLERLSVQGCSGTPAYLLRIIAIMIWPVDQIGLFVPDGHGYDVPLVEGVAIDQYLGDHVVRFDWITSFFPPSMYRCWLFLNHLFTSVPI